MSLENEIIQAEAQLREAMLASDVATLETLIADDLLFVNPSGYLVSKAMDLEAHSTGLLKFEKLELCEREIRDLGDVAVATSRFALQGTYGQTPIAGDYRYTRVWKKLAGSWKVIAGHCGAVV